MREGEHGVAVLLGFPAGLGGGCFFFFFCERGGFYLESFALDVGGEDERDERSRVADFAGFSGHWGRGMRSLEEGGD